MKSNGGLIAGLGLFGVAGIVYALQHFNIINIDDETTQSIPEITDEDTDLEDSDSEDSELGEDSDAEDSELGDDDGIEEIIQETRPNLKIKVNNEVDEEDIPTDDEEIEEIISQIDRVSEEIEEEEELQPRVGFME